MLNSSRKTKTITVLKGSIVILSLMLLCHIFFLDTATAGDNIIKLRYSSSYMPFAPPNLLCEHTMDLIEKESNGRVNFNRFMGGTLGGPLEHIGMLSARAVDVIGLHIGQQQLPIHGILSREQLVTAEEALANVRSIMFEIPETKAILDDEQEQNNMKILSGNIMGTTGITTNFAARSLADLKGKKVTVVSGSMRKVFQEFGWIPVSIQIPEMYEALSRGLIEAIFMPTAAILPQKWYEIGKSHLIMNEAQAVNIPLTVNLEVWSSLPNDIKKIFIESSEETAKWSIETDNIITHKVYEAFKKANAPLIKISDEENKIFWEAYFKFGTEDYLANAEKLGVLDKAKVILKHWEKTQWGN